MKNHYFFYTLKLIYKNSPIRFLVCIGLLIFASSFSLLNLMAMNMLITRLTESAFKPEELIYPGIAFVVTLLLNNAKPFVNMLGSYIWITAEMALQSALIKKAADKSLIFYDTPEFYESLTKAERGYKNALGTTMMLLSAIFVSLFSVIFMAGYLAQIDWRITVALAFIVLVKSISYRAETRSLRTLREKQAADSRKCELLSSYFWTKETRIYGACGYFLNQWKELNRRLKKDQFTVECKNKWFSFLWDSVTYFCYGTVMVLSVYELLHGGKGASVGGIVILFVVLDSIFTNMDTVVAQFGSLMENASLSKSLFDFLSAEDMPLKKKKFMPDVAAHMENVSFAYPSAGHDTLKNIDLTVYPGENIAIVGKNGSGKSTFVKLLCGLYEPGRGDIRYGYPLELSEDKFENIAAMFQNVNTYCLSLAENVCISETEKGIDEKKAEEILRNVMGEKWLCGYPEGVKTKVGRVFGGIELSGGEKQRISLARTLFRDSTLVFFDEPASALDPLAEDRLYQEILNISQDKTTFFITHRLSSVRFADRIIVLDKGEIAEEGTYEELMARNGLFAEMYLMQKQGLV